MYHSGPVRSNGGLSCYFNGFKALAFGELAPSTSNLLTRLNAPSLTVRRPRSWIDHEDIIGFLVSLHWTPGISAFIEQMNVDDRHSWITDQHSKTARVADGSTIRKDRSARPVRCSAGSSGVRSAGFCVLRDAHMLIELGALVRRKFRPLIPQ